MKEGVFPENPLSDFKKRRDEGRIVSLDAETLSKLLGLPDRSIFAFGRQHRVRRKVVRADDLVMPTRCKPQSGLLTGRKNDSGMVRERRHSR